LYPWTDITYLLHKNNISWTSFSETGNQDVDPDEQGLDPSPSGLGFADEQQTYSIWNVLPFFTDVQQDGEFGISNADSSLFFQEAAAGTLPSVSWVSPNQLDSEHPTPGKGGTPGGGANPPYNRVSDGMAWTTSVINAAMQSPDWSSTAIF